MFYQRDCLTSMVLYLVLSFIYNYYYSVYNILLTALTYSSNLTQRRVRIETVFTIEVQSLTWILFCGEGVLASALVLQTRGVNKQQQ